MARSVIRTNRKHLEKTLGLGVQLDDPADHVPASYLEDPYTCPYVESCEGAKDSDFSSRCSGTDFEYRHCRIYQIRANHDDRDIVSVSNPLTETVIMDADAILRLRPSHRGEHSLNEEIEDADPVRVAKLIGVLR
jgi:hypothetical protein